MKKETKKTSRTSIKRHSIEEVKHEEPISVMQSTPPMFVPTKKWLIVSGVILLVLLVLGFVKRGRDEMMTMKTKTIPEIVTKIVGDPTVTLKDVANLKEVSGMYKFELQLDYSGTIRKFTSYISKDGKMFFTTGIKVSDLTKNTTPEAEKKLTCDDVKKVDTANLTAFVVADCPYGLQMQRVMSKMIGENAELGKQSTVKYIGSIVDGKITSMHGDKEAQENLRQICIRDEQATLYWPYVSCYMKEGKSDGCVASTGVDKNKLSTCQTDPARGIAYAKKDFDEATKFEIGSSPTLLLNGEQMISEFDFGGRTPDALQSILCCGSKNKPGFCDKPLSKDAVPASFSLTDAVVAGSTTTAANCGN